MCCGGGREKCQCRMRHCWYCFCSAVSSQSRNRVRVSSRTSAMATATATHTRSFELRIAHTWDGNAADEVEMATVTLTLPPLPSLPSLPADAACQTSIPANHFSVHIDAPFHHDAAPPGMIHGDAYDGLWEFEVVELFLMHDVGNDTFEYLELEFSPHGCHLVCCHWSCVFTKMPAGS